MRRLSRFFALAIFLLVGFATAQEARPAWLDLPLTDARTGEAFTLGGFADKTVFVEPMATWCTTCRRQLTTLQGLLPELGEDTVIVALSVEGNLPDAALAGYAEREGFDFYFAVAPVELLQALVDAFGRSAINPPSAPHFLVFSDGGVSGLELGVKPPEALLAYLAAER